MWKPEQRAMGEAMIGSWRDGPSCVGYGEFCARWDGDEAKWAEPITRDLVALSRGEASNERIMKVQHLLVGLIELLDPDQLRYAPGRLVRA
jgi:hypothetical protein